MCTLLLHSSSWSSAHVLLHSPEFGKQISFQCSICLCTGLLSLTFVEIQETRAEQGFKSRCTASATDIYLSWLQVTVNTALLPDRGGGPYFWPTRSAAAFMMTSADDEDAVC